LSPTLTQHRDRFAVWMTDFVKSPRLSRTLKPGDLALIKTHLAAFDAAVRQQSESATRIAALRQKLSQNLAQLNAGAQADVIKEQAGASIVKLDRALNSIQQNAQLHAQLLEQSKAIKALTQASLDPNL
jgi:hypothetical protein